MANMAKYSIYVIMKMLRLSQLKSQREEHAMPTNRFDVEESESEIWSRDAVTTYLVPTEVQYVSTLRCNYSTVVQYQPRQVLFRVDTYCTYSPYCRLYSIYIPR